MKNDNAVSYVLYVWFIILARVGLYTLLTTVKCRTIIKALFVYFNVCLRVMLDSHVCLFISI